MKQWVCPVCGYVHTGDTAPEKCPQCGVPGAKFKLQEGNGLDFVCEHHVGDGIVDETSSQLEITHRFDGYGVFDVKLSVQDNYLQVRRANRPPRVLFR